MQRSADNQFVRLRAVHGAEMPTISTRTPGGDSLRCPLCGEVSLEASLPTGDVPCPSCGQLLWLFRHGDDVFLVAERRLPKVVRKLIAPYRKQLGLKPSNEEFASSSQGYIHNLGRDSLATVELVMELEEEFDINIPDEWAEKIQSPEDVIRYFLERLPDEDD